MNREVTPLTVDTSCDVIFYVNKFNNNFCIIIAFSYCIVLIVVEGEQYSKTPIYCDCFLPQTP